MSFGLLIQGPLLSIGRSGESAGISSGSVTDEDVVHYDCVKNIHNIILNYGDLFDEIVISTWKDQDLEYQKIDKEKICYFVENLPRMKDKPSANIHVATNNMLKQFYGTYLGLKEFDNVDYIIKIRTDIYINLQSSLSQVVNNCSDNTILIPALYRGSQYIEDFYFAGKYSTIREMFYLLVKDHRYLSESPHTNIWLKYAFEKYKQKISANECFYYEESCGSIGYFLIFEYMRKNVFKQFSVDVFSEMCWRGGFFDSNYKKGIIAKYREDNRGYQGKIFEYLMIFSNAIGCNVQRSICLARKTIVLKFKGAIRRLIR